MHQRTQYDALGFFFIVGYKTGRWCRVSFGTSMNVQEVDEARNPRMGWCFVPQGNRVPGDVKLAQKIRPETDELAALWVANRSPPGPLP